MLTGETLKAIRAIKGITQAQLALDAGVSAAGIAEFETGKRDIRASTIVRMCDAMGVTVTYTVNGVDVVDRPKSEKMTRDEIKAIAREAGLTVCEGEQDRVLWDGDIIEAIGRLIEIARKDARKAATPIRVLQTSVDRSN